MRHVVTVSNHIQNKKKAGASSQNGATSSSQVWLTDAKMSEGARKLAAVDMNQDQSFPERARKLAAQSANVPHFERVFSNLRQQLKRKPEDKMEDLDVNTLIWRMFMIVTQHAAGHLGNDNVDNLHETKTVKQLFDVTSELVREQTEIQGISLIDW